MALALEPVRRVRLMSLMGDFATSTERSEGPVTRRGNMFATRQADAALGAHGLSFLVETGRGRARARGLFDFGLRSDALDQNLDYFGTDVASLHALFLSHGHPDHFGGLDAVVARLRRARARVPMLLFVIPSHCSGLTFEAALEQAFPRGFIMDSVGSDYVFER
jgi:metal-dependent hydrolase (beta-lactamase superfamily II)